MQNTGPVVTIGNFDGVHLGHQALLKKVKDEAKALNTHSMVIIFEPQPLEFFARGNTIPRLTRFREKFHQFRLAGIDEVLIIRFNDRFASLSAEDFVKKVLFESLHVQKVLIGDDFRFGKQRLGDVNLLKSMGESLGFTVEITQDVVYEGERISSTGVRKALQMADLQQAEQLLGRPYAMLGRVVYGDQRGRILGFPTANIYLHRRATPVMGIYAVKVKGLGHKTLLGVANIGTRPTFGGTRILLEVHIFDFNENIYGKYVSVEFSKKLRDEEYFPNAELLKAQIWQDAIDAKAYFKEDHET
jgi:riboflavin kinase/FMN adenylyltransferase